MRLERGHHTHTKAGSQPRSEHTPGPSVSPLRGGGGGHRNILLGRPEPRQRNEVSEPRARPVPLISPRPKSGSPGERLPTQNQQTASRPIRFGEIITHCCKFRRHLSLISTI